MPRRLLSTPKDNVGELLSQSKASPFQPQWQEQELARRREQYAEELRAQIKAKEESKLRENSSFPANPSEPPPPSPLPKALPSPLASPTRHNQQPSNLSIEYNACYSPKDDKFPIDMGLPSPPPPVHTRLSPQPSLPSPSSAPATFPPMTKKERFIAAMESGITRTQPKAHRSATAPVPVVAAVTPTWHARSDDDEAAEALRRKEKFKEDLEKQIQENKRLKQIEAERERQWEMEQEARLEKEREQLRKEFEAEHAARRAKLADDAASNALLAGSRAAKGDPSDGVQIFASKQRKPTFRPETATKEGKNQQMRRRSSTDPPSSAGGGNKKVAQVRSEASETSIPASPLAQRPMEFQETERRKGPFGSAPQPLTKQSSGSEVAAAAATPATGTATAAAQAALSDQVAEIQRLREALHQDLSLQKNVLELMKEANLTATAGTAPIVTLAPLAAQPGQLAVYPNSNACAQVQAVAPPPAVSSRTIPILYTTSELRLEDSRPQSRAMSAPPQSSHHRPQKGKLSTGSRLGKPASNVQSSKVSAGKGATTRLGASQSTTRVAARAEPWSTLHPPAARKNAAHLTTSALAPGQAAERLTFWKKATKRLRKLAVARVDGAKEAAWVIQEESSTQL